MTELSREELTIQLDRRRSRFRPEAAAGDHRATWLLIGPKRKSFQVRLRLLLLRFGRLLSAPARSNADPVGERVIAEPTSNEVVSAAC
jgi:hypothetical protein